MLLPGRVRAVGRQPSAESMDRFQDRATKYFRSATVKWWWNSGSTPLADSAGLATSLGGDLFSETASEDSSTTAHRRQTSHFAHFGQSTARDYREGSREESLGQQQQIQQAHRLQQHSASTTALAASQGFALCSSLAHSQTAITPEPMSSNASESFLRQHHHHQAQGQPHQPQQHQSVSPNAAGSNPKSSSSAANNALYLSAKQDSSSRSPVNSTSHGSQCSPNRSPKHQFHYHTSSPSAAYSGQCEQQQEERGVAMTYPVRLPPRPPPRRHHPHARLAQDDRQYRKRSHRKPNRRRSSKTELNIQQPSQAESHHHHHHLSDGHQHLGEQYHSMADNSARLVDKSAEERSEGQMALEQHQLDQHSTTAHRAHLSNNRPLQAGMSDHQYALNEQSHSVTQSTGGSGESAGLFYLPRMRGSGRTATLRAQNSRQYSIDQDDFEEELSRFQCKDETNPNDFELELEEQAASERTGEEDEQGRLAAMRRQMYSKQLFGNVNMDGFASRFGQYRPYLHNYGRRRYRPRPPNIERSNTEPASQTLSAPFTLLSPSVSPSATGPSTGSGGSGGGRGGGGAFHNSECNPFGQQHSAFGNSSSASSLLLMMMNSQGCPTPTQASAATSIYGGYQLPPSGANSGGHLVSGAAHSHTDVAGSYLDGSTSSISSTSTGVSMHLHPSSAAHASSSRLLPQPKLSQVGSRSRGYIFSSQSVDECSTGLGEADLVSMMNRNSLNECAEAGQLKSTYTSHFSGYEGGGASGSGNSASNCTTGAAPSHHTKRHAFVQASYSIDVPDRVSLYVPATCTSTSPSMPFTPYMLDNRRLSPVYGVDGLLLAGARPLSGGASTARLLQHDSTASRRSSRTCGSGRPGPGGSVFSKQLSLTNAAACGGSLSSSPVEKDDAEGELYCCPLTGAPSYGISQGANKSAGGIAHRNAMQRVSRRRLPTIKSLPLITDPLAEPADSSTSSPSNSYSYYISQISNNTSPNHSYANIAGAAPQSRSTASAVQQQQQQQQHCSAANRSYDSSYAGNSHSPVNPPDNPSASHPQQYQQTSSNSGKGGPALAVPSLRLTHSFGSSTELSTSLSRSGGGGPPSATMSPQQTAHKQSGNSTSTSHLAPGTRHSLSSSAYRLHDIHKQYSFDNADLSRHSPYAELDDLPMMIDHSTAHDAHRLRHSNWHNRTPEIMGTNNVQLGSSSSGAAWSPKSNHNNNNPNNKSPQFQRRSPQSTNYLRRLPLPNSTYIWRSLLVFLYCQSCSPKHTQTQHKNTHKIFTLHGLWAQF